MNKEIYFKLLNRLTVCSFMCSILALVLVYQGNKLSLLFISISCAITHTKISLEEEFEKGYVISNTYNQV